MQQESKNKKNETIHYYHNSFSYDDKSQSQHQTQTHIAWNFEENIKSALPVWPNFVNRTHFHPNIWVDHTNFIYTAVEIPLEGNMRFRQRDESIVVAPGEAYLIHRGENSRLECGPAGFCRKISIGLSGNSLPSILMDTGLINYTRIKLADPEKVFHLIVEIEKRLNVESKPDELVREISILCYTLLLELARALRFKYPTTLAKAMELMTINLARKLTIRQIVGELNISQDKLEELFLRRFRKSPKEYFLDLKMEKAKQLLSRTDLSVKQIANQLGYQDQMNFSRLFRKKTGKNPMLYRKTESNQKRT